MSYPNVHKMYVITFIVCDLWGFEECSTELYAYKYVDMGLDVNVRKGLLQTFTHTRKQDATAGLLKIFQNQEC